MILNECGKIAFGERMKLPQRFSNFNLDVFQIMPNHIHGIIILNEPVVVATLAVAPKIRLTKTIIKGQPQGLSLRYGRYLILLVHTNRW